MTTTGHNLYRVIRFEIVGNHVLGIQFDDGTRQPIDFEPVLYGSIFGPLRDVEVSNQVELVEYTGCLEWPTGADLDPETVLDWPQYVGEILKRRQV